MSLDKSRSKREVETASRRLAKAEQVSARPTRTSARQHPWKVVHACEVARSIMPLVEGQIAVGMRPFLLTPGGYGSPHNFLAAAATPETPLSLLQTWNHVCEWRRLLNESAAETSSDVVHAHSFAAGMAAVRGSSGVVYQLKVAVERLAASAGNCEDNSWLARSFRVAEQFVLTRAAAVVVESHTQRLLCLERGIGAEHVFLIPEPVSSDLVDSVPDREWMERTANGDAATVFFLIPGLAHRSRWERRDSLRRWMRVLSVVRQENAKAKFVFLEDPMTGAEVMGMAAACALNTSVEVLAPGLRAQAIAAADVVMCDREHAASGAALEALARGRALLAADVEEHRDITADGRGCLWFRSADVGDIAHRARFLAGNAQFRRALGVAAREHCIATRSADVIGAQYDAVYRLAFAKRKDRDGSSPKPHLIPLQVGS